MTLEEVRNLWETPEARELPDGSFAGLQRLTTTWSLMLGLSAGGWHYRFCYKDYSDALADLMTVSSEEDIPDGPWIACRPKVTVGHGPDERYPTPHELRELRAKRRA